MALEGNTGISGALGYATESVWGTSVAPKKWAEFLPGETLGRKQNYQRSAGIKAGRTFATGTRTQATTRTAGGGLSMEVPTQGFADFLNLLVGETVTPAKIAATTVYKSVFKIGATDPFNKSMTLVKATPKVGGGVVDSYCYPGTILNQMTLDMAVNGFLVAALDVDAKDEDSSQTIGTVAYPASPENFSFVNTVVKINTVEQKFLRNLKITFAKPTEGDRFMLGSATRLQPLTNAFNSIKLDIEADYDAATLYKFFEKAEAKAVEITFTAGTVEATKLELKLEFPMCRFEGDSPNIRDLGALKQTISLMVEDNTSEAPCTATYVSLEKDLN